VSGKSDCRQVRRRCLCQRGNLFISPLSVRYQTKLQSLPLRLNLMPNEKLFDCLQPTATRGKQNHQDRLKVRIATRLPCQAESLIVILDPRHVITPTLCRIGMGRIQSARFQRRGPQGVLWVGNTGGRDIFGSSRGDVLASVVTLPTPSDHVTGDGIASAQIGSPCPPAYNRVGEFLAHAKQRWISPRFVPRGSRSTSLKWVGWALFFTWFLNLVTIVRLG